MNMLRSPILTVALAFGAATAMPAMAQDGAACMVPGHWQVPGGEVMPRSAVIERASRAQVVLLGENHDDAAHHRWQLETLAALYRVSPGLSVGVEMFPRRLQPVLDAWGRGELDEAAFLEQTDWKKTWGFESELYMPIFRFVRDHRIPLHALNVDRSEVRKVSGGGWQALDPALAAELGVPAAPVAAYRDNLREVYDGHMTHLPEGHKPKDGDFERFVDAQLLWDRAMAAGIAKQVASGPVVGIMGSGHIRFGHGVPHQLRDLSVSNVYSLVPLAADEVCEALSVGMADVVVAPLSGPAPANPHRRAPAGQQQADDGSVSSPA